MAFYKSKEVFLVYAVFFGYNGRRKQVK